MPLIHVRMAVDAIRRAKWRSFLTMLGVIVGVMSVVTIISIGEGVKRQITGEIDRLGPDLITIRPGKVIERNPDGSVNRVDVLRSISGGASTLSDNDLAAVSQTPDIGLITPVGVLNSSITIDGREYGSPTVLGVDDSLPAILKQKMDFGGFFDSADTSTSAAAIGEDVAREIFKENAPIGRTLQIRGQSFVVRGVFKRFPDSLLGFSLDYNKAVFIPYQTAKRINGEQGLAQEILVRPTDPAKTEGLAQAIQTNLRAARAGQNDFSVLRQKDNLAIAGHIITIVTAVITGVATLSLIVGGVGIMNIMFVSVSERTGEIGVRKAVGATNGQVLWQFVTESAMLSFAGGVLGILGALGANYFIRILTDLKPVVSWEAVVLALATALLVGTVFGITPAAKAARKDPIEALRHHA